ncbi:MAG: alpha-amylase family glycosyl hydrolase [Ginsengibacter sp.]
MHLAHKYNLIALCLLCFCNGSAQDTTFKSGFHHPAWAAQSNVYEVNLRQYSAAGTFKEFEKHLQRLKNMGVEILWFMPITPIGIEGRKMTSADLGSYYAVRKYKAVSKEFGTMNDWKALVKHAHSLGFKVIIDWVPNHSSPDNPWTKNHPDFYVKDSAGNIIPPNPDWTDTRQLDYGNRELRDSMIDAMKFWIRETGIDGYRCDQASRVPLDFWKNAIAQLKKIKNVLMIAEAEGKGIYEAGFDIMYTWTVFHSMNDLYKGTKTLPEFLKIIDHNYTAFGSNGYRLYFTTNHDENSWNGTEFEKLGNAYKAFAVFTQTMYQSVPLIYSGQEVPNKKRLKFFVKDPIQWNKYEMASFYKTLLKLRRNTPALAADASYKKLVTTNDVAIFAYLRQKAGYKVGVILNLSNQPQRFTIKEKEIYGQPLNIFLGVKEKLHREHVYSIEPWGYILYNY